ncbi:TPA: hypothetical protein ACPUUO_004761 [Klebsiella pneumoniae]
MSSEFKGTPGPWSVNEIGQHWNNKSLTHLEVTFGEDGECICDTVYRREDANLIASAPRLLEVAISLLEALESENPKAYSDIIDEARAEIAKALGESK